MSALLDTVAPLWPLSVLQIGFIVSGDDRPATGSERYYWDLIDHLPSHGISAHGLVVGNANALAGRPVNVDTFAHEGESALMRVKNLRRLVAACVKDTNVIVSHHAQHTLPVLDLIRNRPLVQHFHGPLVREGRAEGVSAKNIAFRAFAERLVYRRAARIIVLSDSFAGILHDDYGYPADRIRVIPGAADLSVFKPRGSRLDARRRLGWPEDRPIVVAVRRLAATKGLENLIDAIDEVRRACPDVLAYLVGSGPHAAALRARVTERGLDRWVRFTGRLGGEFADVYRAADVSIVPSLDLEGFGLVVAESLACGTPALVTPVTGLPEVVKALDPALILGGSDVRSIAAGLTDVIRGRIALPDPDRCSAYAQRFDWRTIARQISDVYREVA